VRTTPLREEENRTPVGRPDFKSGERRSTSLVGSTPTLFRQRDPALSMGIVIAALVDAAAVIAGFTRLIAYSQLDPCRAPG
jgi:hypothetical protein